MPTFASTGGLPTACRKSPSFIQLAFDMIAQQSHLLSCHLLSCKPVGLICFSKETLCSMDTQLEQLASQIRAELQAVRELEFQIDPEDVDGLQVGALFVACGVCALLCITNHMCSWMQAADSHDSGISPPSPLEIEQQGLALRARKHKKRKCTDAQGFSLQDINEQLAQVLADPSQQRVELGVLKKSQARQVCCRINLLAGHTLFASVSMASLHDAGECPSRCIWI